MRRLVVILPNLLRTEDDSVLREARPSLRSLTEAGEVVRVRMPQVETPEALYLGMSPREAQMRPGPLIVSALGADPPERSTHFHLSLLTLEDAIGMPEPPTAEEAQELFPLFGRLDTKTLTILRGEGLDHALVWEGLGDLGTTAAEQAVGKAVREVAPEGDNERALRRFIDDSVNLLAETETNRRRLDEGRRPLNLLWPWGQGVRTRAPNLLLRRGEITAVYGATLRLAGLTRLTGYPFHRIGSGTKSRFELPKEEVSIVVFQPPTDAEEQDWFLRELDARMLAHWPRNEPSLLQIIALGEEGGLSLRVEFPSSRQNGMPFDERALDEGLPLRDLSDLVHSAVTHGNAPA